MSKKVLAALERTKALRHGHFVFKSGLHCGSYLRADDLLIHSIEMHSLVEELARPFMGRVDVVMGPHFGGNPLAVLTAAVMSRAGHEVIWIPTIKDADTNQIVEPRRGFEAHLPGKRVLVVEDTTTTGKSPGKVVKLAHNHSAEVVGVAAINSYGGDIAAGAGVSEVHILNEFNYPTHEMEVCPYCQKNEPIVIDKSLGHGWEFQRDHPEYPGGFVQLLDTP